MTHHIGVTMQYTHKGWFFLCPVYLNADDGEGMQVEARHEWLEWWFTLQLMMFEFIVEIILFINPEYDPVFPFKVTGKLNGNN